MGIGTVTTLTQKGQVTIPKEIRDRLDLKPFDRIKFEIVADGTVQLRKAGPSLEDVVGILPALGLSDEEIKRVTEEALAEHFAEKYR
jgi:AbrB family looped-hinge helix DNA binding protein